MSPIFQNSSLLIIGHGSTVNPDSSTPTHQCADEIRRRGIFAEVHCAFWKEEPSMREVFYSVRSDLIFVVPNFISEGYFTREVLPREMMLEGALTQRDGKTIIYGDPVGIHPHMTRLLLHRADEVAPGVPRGETSLVIVGHGTGLNEQSRKAIEAQVALIRAENHGFAEVCDAYMEEAPLVADWDKITAAPNVVVVPFFIADGLHSYQDIPVLLGIESEPTAAASQNEIFRHNPHLMRGKKLFYSSAVGTDPLMVDVILDQANDAAAKAGALKAGHYNPENGQWTDEITIGQVSAELQKDGSWMLHHCMDHGDDASLRNLTTMTEAREMALTDEAGNFRALKMAPTLRRGWRMVVPGNRLEPALEAIYPGLFGLWRHFKAGTLRPVSLRETLGRQTGMYRFANNISDDDANAIVAHTCAASQCLRRITWQLGTDKNLDPLPADKSPPAPESAADITLLCAEACPHVVSAAREKARGNYLTKNS